MNSAAINASLTFSGPNGILSKTLQAVVSSLVTKNNFFNTTATVPITTPVAIPLGDLTNLGWLLIINNDPTHFITVLNETGGKVICQLMPGEPCFFRAGTDVTAPFWVADTATCKAEVLAIEI